jgi:hypothetical protein
MRIFHRSDYGRALAEHFGHSVESTLFRDGVSAVERMTAYAVSAG